MACGRGRGGCSRHCGEVWTPFYGSNKWYLCALVVKLSLPKSKDHLNNYVVVALMNCDS